MHHADLAGWGCAALSTLTALVQAWRVVRRGPHGANAPFMIWLLVMLHPAERRSCAPRDG